MTVRSQLDGDLHICIVKEEESVSPAGKMIVLWHIVCSVSIAVDRYSHFRNTICGLSSIIRHHTKTQSTSSTVFMDRLKKNTHRN